MPKVKKITVDTDFFFEHIGDLDSDVLDFVRENLNLKSMSIPETKLQELYEMVCYNGQELLKDEFSGVYDFKKKGAIMIDDSTTAGWDTARGEAEGENIFTMEVNTDEEDECMGTITYDQELYKLEITEVEPGTFEIRGQYV